MPELPGPIRALDLHYEQSEIAHFANEDAYRQLVALDAASDQAAEILRTSASIALTELPNLLRDLLDAARRWEDEAVLDPRTASATLREIEEGLVERADQLGTLHRRQRMLAKEISLLVAEARG